MRKKRTSEGRIKTAGGLARKASARQRKLYGLTGHRTPQHERERSWLDAKYVAALKANPEAELWLSVYNEEAHRCVYMAGEPHIHSIEQLRQLDRERKSRKVNEDIMSFSKLRGPSLDQLADGEAWVNENSEELENEEDRRIAAIDRARAIATRGEDA